MCQTNCTITFSLETRNDNTIAKYLEVRRFFFSMTGLLTK